MGINSLKEILNPYIICGLNTSNPSQATIVLKETSITKLQPILLTIPTHECLVFQLDKPQKKFASKSNFLHSSKGGIHQACDYVVACIHGGRWQFVCIELKSDVTSGAVNQLWHTTPFIT